MRAGLPGVRDVPHPDGLNGQVYNRCVGTRYCSNNCPYKVRYFNWFKYDEMAWPEPLNRQLNPDVTVRARGVMEKCTFCVQRIRGAQNQARLEDRPHPGRGVHDGLRPGLPVATRSCSATCSDPRAAWPRIKQDRRGYHVLEELNTRPAVTYLAKVLHSVEA